MIPRIIHYCWFGRGEKPEFAKKCIASWKKFCPDFEIREWNEDNCDCRTVPFMAEAYAAKKYAFVSDVIRLIVLEQYGGVYFDTDVEVLRDITPLLGDEGFIGFENDGIDYDLAIYRNPSNRDLVRVNEKLAFLAIPMAQISPMKIKHKFGDHPNAIPRKGG